MEHHPLAADHDFSLVGLVDAADHAHERALAGTVLTHERVDLASSEREVHSANRTNTAEGLVHASQLDRRADNSRFPRTGGGQPMVRLAHAPPRGMTRANINAHVRSVKRAGSDGVNVDSRPPERGQRA